MTATAPVPRQRTPRDVALSAATVEAERLGYSVLRPRALSPHVLIIIASTPGGEYPSREDGEAIARAAGVTAPGVDIQPGPRPGTLYTDVRGVTGDGLRVIVVTATRVDRGAVAARGGVP